MKTFKQQNEKSVYRMMTRVGHRRAYWAVIGLVAAFSGLSQAQTNTPPISGSATNVTQLGETTVVGKLDEARNKIAGSLGANDYSVGPEQIAATPGGASSQFNQVMLRTPGVSQDSFGQLHVRNEHAFVQYRFNDVILPEGITGFGTEVDTRFISSLDLITGTLPAQYGFRTAGVVDIHTKSGAFNDGGEVSIYGGSYDTYRPSFEYGGKDGKLNYYFSGSYLHSGIGVENPTGSSNPIHDNTDQYKGFGYFSYVLDDTSRLTLMLSASHSDFQIPNNPGQPAGTDPNNNPFPLGGATFNSANNNENQTEQNYYSVLAYQKSAGDFNMQLSAYSHLSTVLFRPDYFADLYFNGVASRVDRSVLANGLQGDASYDIGDKHTVRGGFQVISQRAIANSLTGVFNITGAGDATAPPFQITDNNSKWGWLYGAYLQDEWKISPKWTVNYGARVDVSDQYIQESEIEPRVNAIFKPTTKTTIHAGYARNFTPPPLEGISPTTVGKFANTSNGSANTQDDPVKSERAHYFDVGVTQTILPGLQVGLDGYYKIASQQLDDGQFGSALIVTPFNYHRGIVEGVEATATYKKDGFSAFGNLALSQEKAREIDSAQFNFAPGDLAYIKNNYIYTDHSQTLTGSGGLSYKWQNTLAYLDVLYGNGLRADGDVPNGRKLPSYTTLNLGVEQTIKLPHGALKARLDIVNVADEVYEIRDGTGVGVGAPQFGMRRGFFGSLSYAF